jgi:hypothetical protein
MPNVTLYLPDDQHKYLKSHDLSPSELLQAAIRVHQAEHDALEAKFREELEKYRNDPERKAEWERLDGWGPDDAVPPFVACETCGTAVDPFEGCMAVAEPYEAAAVALLAHYPDDIRRANLSYWEQGSFKDVTLGMPG